MATVQCTDPQGKSKVERRFTGMEGEVLDRRNPKAQAAGSNLRLGRRDGLGDRLGRSIDAQDVSAPDPRRNCTCSGAGAAADFQNTEAWLERQGVDGRLQSG